MLSLVKDTAQRYALCIIISSAILICGLFAWVIPISPGSDSFTLVNSLKYLQNGTGFTEWSTKYFNFWGNNKVALLIYYFFTLPFSMFGNAKAIEYGIRLTHFVMLLTFVFSAAFTSRQLFGEKFFRLSFFISVTIYPYVILTAPYVYPLSISMAMLCFCAGLRRSAASCALFVITFGVLFMLRPTSAVFIVTYHLAAIIRSCIAKDADVKRRLLIFAALLISVPATGRVTGFALQKSNFHPYPNFASMSTLWTVYVGTNHDGAHSGRIMYNVDITPEPDGCRLAVLFHETWLMAARNDPADYREFRQTQNEIQSLLMQRIRDTILDSPSSLFSFLRHKTANLFDPESPYVFFHLNAAVDNFGNVAAANIHGDSDRYFGIIAVSAALSLLFLLIFYKIHKDLLWIALPAAAGVFGTIFIFVTLTEVSPRYLADTLPALTVIVMTGLAALMKYADGKYVTVILASIFIAAYSSNDSNFWRGAETELHVYSDTATLIITFKSDPPPGYTIRHRHETPLTKTTEITFTPGSILYLHSPKGVQPLLTHDPINQERFFR